MKVMTPVMRNARIADMIKAKTESGVSWRTWKASGIRAAGAQMLSGRCIVGERCPFFLQAFAYSDYLLNRSNEFNVRS
jgi:hypothetical protein